MLKYASGLALHRVNITCYEWRINQLSSFQFQNLACELELCEVVVPPMPSLSALPGAPDDYRRRSSPECVGACCLGHPPLTDSVGKGHQGSRTLARQRHNHGANKGTRSPLHLKYHTFNAAVSGSSGTDDAAASVLILPPCQRGLKL